MLIDVFLRDIGIEIRRLYEPKEELIDYLQVRPCHLQYGFIFLRIKSVASWVDLWGYCAEEVDAKLDQSFRKCISPR